MNCRAKTPFWLRVRHLVTGLCGVRSRGFALYAFVASFVCVNIAVAQEENLSSYPPFIYNVMNRLSRWQPSPEATPECKLTFSSEKLDPHACEANYDLNPLDNFKSRLFIQFDMTDPSRFHKIDIQLKPDLVIRGLVGLHPGEKRPLVIFRMGIHGNIDEFLAERFLAKLVYEDLGYNFLVLESLTSHGFLVRNKRVSIGGVEEGLHTFYVINMIANNQFEWAQDITDLYLMGVSMSGPGVFLATYLDENYQHKLKSVQLFCPLVNMELTFKQHAEKQNFFSAFADIWNRRRLKAILDINPELREVPWWLTLLDWRPRFTPAAMHWLNQAEPKPLLDLDTFKQKFPGVKFPKEFEDHVAKSTSLYQLNDFWSFYKNEKTPIHVGVTPTDRIVVNEFNSDMIRKHQQQGSFVKTEFQDLRGFHCSLAAEYQWPFLAELLRRDLK